MSSRDMETLSNCFPCPHFLKKLSIFSRLLWVSRQRRIASMTFSHDAHVFLICADGGAGPTSFLSFAHAFITSFAPVSIAPLTPFSLTFLTNFFPTSTVS